MQKTQQRSKSVVSVVLVEANHMNCQLVERALRPQGRHVAVAGSAFRRSEVLALLKERQPDVAVISAQLQEGALEGYRVLPDLGTVSGRTRGIILPHSRGARVGSRCFPVRGARSGFPGRAVRHGQIWADSENMRPRCRGLEQGDARAFSRRGGMGRLSKRETDVARLVARKIALPRP
jgi:hypothetical protein